MKISLNRWLLYIVGILILVFGLIMNSKSSLGVSPILSVAYVVSDITGMKFGDATFILYIVFVIVEYFLLKDWKVILQLPYSIIFTRFMNLVSSLLTINPTNIVTKLLTLAVGVICTGIGATLTLNMKIVANPGDGIVDALRITSKKEMGLVKNIFDCSCVCCALLIGFIFKKPFSGIGLGTLLAVIFVGRVIALFNRLFMKKILKIAKMDS